MSSMVGDSQISLTDVALEAHFTCNAVGGELWLAILCSLLCPEMDWNIRIGKARLYVLILRSDVLTFHS